ncbi:unnamed protein product [Pieris brassicae]|uniref:Uncharacterized protein n=1 Tax=Pieris brassicae TaxID=7116 RepID=A0A9P0XBN7_PIEBR|nr:unnamed protein product [Pieris brassicae]
MKFYITQHKSTHRTHLNEIKQCGGAMDPQCCSGVNGHADINIGGHKTTANKSKPASKVDRATGSASANKPCLHYDPGPSFNNSRELKAFEHFIR